MIEPEALPPTHDETVDALIARRRLIRAWWNDGPHDTGAAGAGTATGGDGAGAWTHAEEPTPVGLALSGGGIRSATFSLGLLQALAKSSRNALDKVDVLSTVSGGGYVGCFLRSLFVPTTLRGIGDPVHDPHLPEKVANQYRLAHHALSSGPGEREFDWTPALATAPVRLRNPVWWLREHSRYLAPTGPSDFGFAVAYIARNWLAMIYLVMLAAVALGGLLVAAETGVLSAVGATWRHRFFAMPLSPLYALALAPIAWAAALMIAYWSTQAMSTNERDAVMQRRNLYRASLWIVVAALLVGVIIGAAILVHPGTNTQAMDGLGRRFLVILAVGALVTMTGAVAAMIRGHLLRGEKAMLASELRRWLTGRLATSNMVLLGIVAVATVDSLGAWIDATIRRTDNDWTLAPAAVLPALAFVIKKLPDWFGSNGESKPGGGIAGLLRRFATTMALLAGFLLYLLVAAGALAIVHHAAWEGMAWRSDVRLGRLALLVGVAWVLAVLLGRSHGFINLSSLHALYASRLTRAYLGASNVERLERAAAKPAPGVTAAPITENHDKDYIQPHLYSLQDLPAPLHVINVTLNETIDPTSQIVARDRKGCLLSVEPSGVRVGGDLFVPWRDLRSKAKAELISLGQWCAISGAAASSAMGRMTSLGFALAFTFANVRLGYWWHAPDLCPAVPKVGGASGWVARHFGTFVYLLNEMTCRYSRGYSRKYLTDGGHYENSGAFVLIRRRVPLIVVTDNGADPDYAFADLETLIRQVRLDLGFETTVLGGGVLASAVRKLGATDRSIFVDPLAHPNWRERMTVPTDPAYVLMLHIATGGDPLTMLWIKPRLLPDVPADVAGYQLAMKAFPQQPTGDQFFDEAQWESYRRLGELSMTRLLETCPKLLA